MSIVLMKINKELKIEAEALFNEMGMNMNTAVSVFLKKAVRDRKIPFDLTADCFDETTEELDEEAEPIIATPPHNDISDGVEETSEDLVKDEELNEV